MRDAFFVLWELFSEEEGQDHDDHQNDRADDDGNQGVLVIPELLSGTFFFFLRDIEASAFIDDESAFCCGFCIANGDEHTQGRGLFQLRDGADVVLLSKLCQCFCGFLVGGFCVTDRAYERADDTALIINGDKSDDETECDRHNDELKTDHGFAVGSVNVQFFNKI